MSYFFAWSVPDIFVETRHESSKHIYQSNNLKCKKITHEFEITNLFLAAMLINLQQHMFWHNSRDSILIFNPYRDFLDNALHSVELILTS